MVHVQATFIAANSRNTPVIQIDNPSNITPYIDIIKPNNYTKLKEEIVSLVGDDRKLLFFHNNNANEYKFD